MRFSELFVQYEKYQNDLNAAIECDDHSTILELDKDITLLWESILEYIPANTERPAYLSFIIDSLVDLGRDSKDYQKIKLVIMNLI